MNTRVIIAAVTVLFSLAAYAQNDGWTMNSTNGTTTTTLSVGIGASAPGIPFAITKSSTYNNESSAGSILMDTVPFTTKLNIGVDPAVNGAYLQTQEPTSYATKSLLFQPNGGKVGIGTTSPNANGPLTISSNQPSGWGQIFLNSSATSGNIRSAFVLTSQGITKFVVGNDLNLNGTNDFFIVQAGMPVPRFYIGANGNVGFNTSSPAAKLHINQPSTYNDESTAGLVVTDAVPFTTKLDVGVDAAAAAAYIQTQAPASYSSKYLALQPNGGNVGIGIVNPAYRLTVAGTVQSTVNGFMFPDGTLQSTAFAPAANGTLTVSSKLGVGVSDAQATLQVAGDFRLGSNGTNTDLRIFTDTPATLNGTQYQQINTLMPVTIPASGTTTHTALYVKTATASGQGSNQFDLIVDGNITSKFQDVAEWVASSGDLAPATVVVLDPSHDDRVMPSSRAYDTTVAGVVSSTPGLILGVGDKGKEKIATTGRVKVRVDATHAPIAIGDLLVTSDVPGTAMRSEPMDINGRKFHQPGTVIGKALQALPGGRGEILVLLSLQ